MSTRRQMKPKRSTGRNGSRRGRNSSSSLVSVGTQENKQTNLRSYGFPDATRVKLAYAQSIIMTQSVASGQYTFSGNSVYDPDVTSGGFQPSEYDLYASAYNRYRVHASEIEVRAVGLSSVLPTRLTVFPSNSPSTTGSVADALTNNRSVERIVGIASGIPYLVRMKATTAQIAGGFNNLLDTRTATISASPTDQWYWRIVNQSYDASTSTTVYLDVRIVYDVEFFDRSLQDVDLLSRLLRLKQAREVYEAQRVPLSAKGEKKEVREETKDDGYVQVSLPQAASSSMSRAGLQTPSAVRGAGASLSAVKTEQKGRY